MAYIVLAGIPLLLMQLSLLQLSKAIEITLEPAPQTVSLGEDATFQCQATGGAFFWKLTTPGLGVAVLSHADPNVLNERGISSTGSVRHVQGTNNYQYMSELTIAGTVENNNTELFCEVSTLPDSSAESNRVGMTVIGTPDPPTGFTIQLLSATAMVFLAEWKAPFAHENHSILYYSLEVLNNHNQDTYNASSCTSCSFQNFTFVAPDQTTVCDVLMLKLTAINSIGSSDPTLSNFTIPMVPSEMLTLETEVKFQSDGIPIVLLRIQFPKLCMFQMLNYTIVLSNLEDDSVVMLPQVSLLPPVELLNETIQSVVVPDAEYTVLVYALTDVGNSTSHPYNFSTHFSPPTNSTKVTSYSPTNNSTSDKESWKVILAIGFGCSAVLLLFIILLSICLCLSYRCRKKKADQQKVTGIRPVLMPNPLYDGPLYETISDNYKSPFTHIPSSEPIYTVSPTHKTMTAGKENNMCAPVKVALPTSQHSSDEEKEDCYVMMQSTKKE